MRRVARVLLACGTAAAVLGFAKLHAAANGYDLTSSWRFPWTLAYIFLLALAAYGAGLPDLVRNRRSALTAALASTAVAAVGMSLAQLLVGTPRLPRFVVLASPAVLVPFYVLCASLSSDGRARDQRRDRVVAVTGLDERIALADDLEGHPERPAVLVRALSPSEAASSDPNAQPLVDAARVARATTVVLDRAAQGDDSIVAQAAALHEAGVRVRTLSLFYDQWLGKLPVSELERISLMFDIGELHRARYGRMKRMLDTLGAAIGAVLLLVVVPIVVVGNLFGNRGPVFFRQARVGKNGRVFRILKFRTMRDAHGWGEWTAADDPRVTRFGQWLRRTHLDELPQVVNILRGDLSVVGPRPEQPQYVEQLSGKIPFYELRHLVRPGLTGWAQVKFPYAASDADSLEKLQYEFYYLRHQGLLLDLRIIGRTLRSVVGRGGR